MDDLDSGAANQTAATESTVSLEDELGAAFDAATAEPAPQKETAKPAGEITAGQSRDPATGKFTKSEGAAQAAAEQTQQSAAPTQAAAPTSNSEQVKPEGSKLPPSSWSVEAKSQWANLPPAIQEAVLKREGEVSEGFRQKSEELKGYAEIGQILAPRQQALTLNYGSPGNALKMWSQMDEFATRDPGGFIKWYAGARGVDLAGLVGGATQPQTQQADPHFSALQGQVQQLGQIVQSQLAQQQQAMEARVVDEVTRFKSDPKHLYYENVKDDMANLIRTGVASTLEEAYERATWQNSDIRSKLIAAQNQQADDARKAEAAQKAAQATRVNATNLSTQGAVAGTTPLSKDDLLGAVFDRMNAA